MFLVLLFQIHLMHLIGDHPRDQYCDTVKALHGLDFDRAIEATEEIENIDRCF